MYKIGCKILDVIEIIHKAGYVHNDICLEKIVIGKNQKLEFGQMEDENDEESRSDTIFDGINLHIADFSFMTPYIDLETKKHLK